MTLTSESARLDGRVVATDLDRALNLLADAERARSQAALLLAELQNTELERFLGYVSWERLIAHRSGCRGRDASVLMRTARHLDRFSLTATALETGVIGWAATEILAHAASGGLGDAYETDETELLAFAENAEPEELERVCRAWRDRADTDAAAADAERRHQQRGVWFQQRFDGSCKGRFELDSTGAELLAKALETQPDSTTSIAEPRTVAQRRADRLIDICQAVLGWENNDSDPGDGDPDSDPGDSGDGDSDPGDGGGDRSGGRSPGAGVRATVDVVIDVETLAGADAPLDRIRAELSRGAPIGGPGLDRLLCDASFRALVTDGARTVLAYNRATPAIPPSLRRAVQLRDRCCTFDGCNRPWWWCDVHHIIPRADGGPTALLNLTLLCRFHHGLVHEGGWQLTRAPDGTITVTSP